MPLPGAAASAEGDSAVMSGVMLFVRSWTSRSPSTSAGLNPIVPTSDATRWGQLNNCGSVARTTQVFYSRRSPDPVSRDHLSSVSLCGSYLKLFAADERICEINFGTHGPDARWISQA